MEPVRAEQLNSTYPAQLPDIGIWRSPLTTRMMLTGRIGVNKEFVTKELPLLKIHVDKIEEYKSILKESEGNRHIPRSRGVLLLQTTKECNQFLCNRT